MKSKKIINFLRLTPKDVTNTTLEKIIGYVTDEELNDLTLEEMDEVASL